MHAAVKLLYLMYQLEGNITETPVAFLTLNMTKLKTIVYNEAVLLHGEKKAGSKPLSTSMAQKDGMQFTQSQIKTASMLNSSRTPLGQARSINRRILPVKK